MHAFIFRAERSSVLAPRSAAALDEGDEVGEGLRGKRGFEALGHQRKRRGADFGEVGAQEILASAAGQVAVSLAMTPASARPSRMVRW